MRYANDFSKEMFLLILGRDKGRGGERDTSAASHTEACNLDIRSEWQPFGARDYTHPTGPHWPRLCK